MKLLLAIWLAVPVGVALTTMGGHIGWSWPPGGEVDWEEVVLYTVAALLWPLVIVVLPALFVAFIVSEVKSDD